MTTVRFSALDTWFFRESRPMESLGGSELGSVFPPSPRTLLGALRTTIGDAEGVDWSAFSADHPLTARIGFGDDLGPLSLIGPWICKGGERLYPAPLFLLEKTLGKRTELARLRIGEPSDTYLGRVRLPGFPKGKQGYKPLEQAWLAGPDLESVFQGNTPKSSAIHRPSDLFRQESRLGIARDNARRITDEGLLYQTRHLRLHPTVGLEAEVTLAEGTPPPVALTRLGGEGRLAAISVVDPAPFPGPPTPNQATRGLILVLLTAARLGSQAHPWLPPGFEPGEQADGARLWNGEIAGVNLRIHAAVLGKVQREGGWNQATHRPRDMQSLIPPGSAFYVTVSGDVASAIAALHGSQVGADEALGRGLIGCALWNTDEF